MLFFLKKQFIKIAKSKIKPVKTPIKNKNKKVVD